MTYYEESTITNKYVFLQSKNNRLLQTGKSYKGRTGNKT